MKFCDLFEKYSLEDIPVYKELKEAEGSVGVMAMAVKRVPEFMDKCDSVLSEESPFTDLDVDVLNALATATLICSSDTPGPKGMAVVSMSLYCAFALGVLEMADQEVKDRVKEMFDAE